MSGFDLAFMAISVLSGVIGLVILSVWGLVLISLAFKLRTFFNTTTPPCASAQWEVVEGRNTSTAVIPATPFLMDVVDGQHIAG